MAPKKKPAAAPQSPGASAPGTPLPKGTKRKRATLLDLEFKPPPASKDSNTKLILFRKDIKQVEETVNAARIKDGPDLFEGAGVKNVLKKLEEYKVAAFQWIDEESNMSTMEMIGAAAAVSKMADILEPLRELWAPALRALKAETEARNEATEQRINDMKARYTMAKTKNIATRSEIKVMQSDQKKKMERKQNELKVVEEMSSRLQKDLKNRINRRTVSLTRLAREQAADPAASAAASSSDAAGSAHAILQAAQRAKAEPKRQAAKAKAKGKGKPGRPKASGAPPEASDIRGESARDAQARREYEMDRRMRIAEAAQPIPGLMPQFNEQGQTVGWMDKNGNWIAGETTRGSKKLLLHLKAMNYDPRNDPDATDGDSTPVRVVPATTPPALQDPLTPISRLSEVSSGAATTDIPTSPESDNERARRST